MNYCHPESFLYSQKTRHLNVNRVGAGKYGQVFVGCTNISCGRRIAVKKSLDDMTVEFKILKRAYKADPEHVPQPYLVKTCEPVGSIMYYQYIPSVTLSKYKKITKPMLFEILKTLYKLNKAGIRHNDVHLKNILIEKKTLRPYITDFGLADVNSAPSLFGNKNSRYDYHMFLNILYNRLGTSSPVRVFIEKVIPKKYLGVTTNKVNRYRLRNNVRYPGLPSLREVLMKLNVEQYK